MNGRVQSLGRVKVLGFAPNRLSLNPVALHATTALGLSGIVLKLVTRYDPGTKQIDLPDLGSEAFVSSDHSGSRRRFLTISLLGGLSLAGDCMLPIIPPKTPLCL